MLATIVNMHTVQPLFAQSLSSNRSKRNNRNSKRVVIFCVERKMRRWLIVVAALEIIGFTTGAGATSVLVPTNKLYCPRLIVGDSSNIEGLCVVALAERTVGRPG